jgi:hypothetical protein
MLTSFATATSSSSSSPYESRPSWWRFNFTPSSYATLTAGFLPSSQESSNIVEKRPAVIDQYHQCELLTKKISNVLTQRVG